MIVYLAGAGCKDEPVQVRAEKPVFCYRLLDHEVPGRLGLRQPVDCSLAVERYRAQGRRDRPEAVDFLDAAGEVRLGYRVRYAADGRPVFEERIFHHEPTSFNMYQRGDRVEFTSTPGRTWEVVRIRTDLDPRGRPSKVEKYVGARREYTIRREFDAAGLKTESFIDAAGELRFRSVFRTEDGRRFETMLDGTGKMLLEREVDPGASGRSSEVLDSPTGYPVQTPQ